MSTASEKSMKDLAKVLNESVNEDQKFSVTVKITRDGLRTQTEFYEGKTEDELIDEISENYALEMQNSSTNPEQVVSDLISGNEVKLDGDGYIILMSISEPDEIPEVKPKKIVIEITSDGPIIDGDGYESEVSSTLMVIARKIANGIEPNFEFSDNFGEGRVLNAKVSLIEQ